MTDPTPALPDPDNPAEGQFCEECGAQAGHQARCSQASGPEGGRNSTYAEAVPVSSSRTPALPEDIREDVETVANALHHAEAFVQLGGTLGSGENLFKAIAQTDVRERFSRITDALVEARRKSDEAEDFRAEIAVDAFTAPDADGGTILDSLRARIQEAIRERDEADQRSEMWQQRIAELIRERDEARAQRRQAQRSRSAYVARLADAERERDEARAALEDIALVHFAGCIDELGDIGRQMQQRAQRALRHTPPEGPSGEKGLA